MVFQARLLHDNALSIRVGDIKEYKGIQVLTPA